MLRRVSGMAFAPSMMVFPGGGVDERDGEPACRGPARRRPSGRPARLLAEPTAQMYVAAAIREVFEECGVLLAGPSASGPLAGVDGAMWRDMRAGLVDRRLSLADVLRGARARAAVRPHRRQGALADPGLRAAPLRHVVLRRAHAALPGADGETTEADHADWFVPAELLRAYAAGSALMLPPTVMCVEEIRDAPSAQRWSCTATTLPLIMPEVVDGPDGPAMEIVER